MIPLESSAQPKNINQSTVDGFIEKPCRLSINENAITRYASSLKIEDLISELLEKGPLIALGQIGPKFYTDKPFKLQHKVSNQDIYGWKPGAQRVRSTQNHVMVLGAKKLNEREYVYFTVSEDVTLNQDGYIRTHQPSKSDTKIYVVSHNTFKNYLCDLYPPAQIPKEQPVFAVSSKPNSCPLLSASEREYVQKLSSISPVESILDKGEVESRCKAIGQEIYDKYKTEKSLTGKDATQRICNAIVFIASDGTLRKQLIERAWNGIGDDNWRWHS